jgi:hypothetical protein
MLWTLDLPTPAGVVERKAKLAALAAIGEA